MEKGNAPRLVSVNLFLFLNYLRTQHSVSHIISLKFLRRKVTWLNYVRRENNTRLNSE